MKTEFYVVVNCPSCKRPNFFKEEGVCKNDWGWCWGCGGQWHLSFGPTRPIFESEAFHQGLRDTSKKESNVSKEPATDKAIDPNLITVSESIHRGEIDHPVNSRTEHDQDRAKELIRGLYRTTYMQDHIPNLQWVRELLEIAERSQIFVNKFGTLGGEKVP